MSSVYHDMQPPSSRVCKWCHVEKPTEEFYKSKAYKSGFLNVCKACMKERRLHPLIVQRPLFPVSQVCKKCHRDKLFEEFDLHKTGRYGRRLTCKACKQKERKQQWAVIKQERLKDALPVIPITSKTCVRCSEEKPIEHFVPYITRTGKQSFRSLCKECERERMALKNKKERIKDNRAMRERSARRHALQRKLSVGEVDYDRILERDGNTCYICEGIILPAHTIHFDHVIPLIRGGAHSEENIKVTHKVCNLRKSTHLLEELEPIQRRGLLSREEWRDLQRW